MRFYDFQASSSLKLADGTVLTACERCRLDHGNNNPPCDNCRVDLLPENEDVALIYLATRNQLVSVDIGKNRRTIDISIPAIESAMRMKGIKNQWECMNRVRKLFFIMREKENEGEDME